MEEIDRIMAWIDQSPAHHSAYAQVERAWHGTPRNSGVQEASLPSLKTPSVSRRQGWHLGAIAASLLAVTVVPLLFWLQAPVKEKYATRTGEHRAVRLQDGSLVELGGGSQLAIEFRRDGRYISLVEGEAMFTVAKDSRRPFMVYSAGGLVKAIGTVFNVNRDNEGVTVGVVEGVVQVRMDTPNSPSVFLQRGNEGSYSTVTGLGPVHQINPDRIGSWRSGSFSFIDRPLGSVVADLNRYASQPIYIDDEALKLARVTGTINADGILEWVQALHQTMPVQVVTANQAIHLRTGPAAKRRPTKAGPQPS